MKFSHNIHTLFHFFPAAFIYLVFSESKLANMTFALSTTKLIAFFRYEVKLLLDRKLKVMQTNTFLFSKISLRG